MTVFVLLPCALVTYTVTVVGGTGALGRELVQQIRERDWTPIVLSRGGENLSLIHI